MSPSAGGADVQLGDRLGLKPGMVVQELGWDEDVDDSVREMIENAIDSDMVDGDHGDVVDLVFLWWRDDDGDLVDALVDSLTDLVGRRRHLAADPEGGSARAPWTPPMSPKPARSRDFPRRRPLQWVRSGRRRVSSRPRTADPAAQEAPRQMLEQLGKQALRQARMVKVMATSGVIRPYSPVTLVGVGKTILDWGIGFAGGIGALAIRSPKDDRADRRARRAHLGRARRAVHPAGPRPAGPRRLRGRQRRRAVPQPPLLPRRLDGAVQARRRHPLPEHRLLRHPARRGLQAREACGDRVRRGVHRADRQVRRRPAQGDRAGTTARSATYPSSRS